MATAKADRWEFLALSLTWGAVVGAALVVGDVAVHRVAVRASDMLIALALVAIPTAIMLGLLTALFSIAACVAHLPLDRDSAIRRLTALVWFCLTGGLIFFVSRGHRDWTGLVLLAAAMTLALPISRLAQLLCARPGTGIVIGLAALNALVIAACVPPMLREWGIGTFARTISVAGFVLVMVLASIRWRHLIRTAGAVLVLLAVSVAFPVFVHANSSHSPRVVHAAKDQPPNIVLVVLDTTRLDYIGCYGRPGLTPSLDALAREGAVYEDFISTAPWTIPSHASMFTGLYPKTHGCSYEHHPWLDDDAVTLTERLQGRGYRTVNFVSNVQLTHCNVLQGFDRAQLTYGHYDNLSLVRMCRALGLPAAWIDKGAAETCRHMEDWLAHDYDPKTPFFMFINLMEAHTPYLPPLAERWRHRSTRQGIIRETEFGLDSARLANQLMIKREIDPLSADAAQSLYAGEIEYQDRMFGRMLSLLREGTDFDNTLVMITADHGENLGEAGRWEHIASINDLLIHVPLVIRYPRLFKAGTRISGLCQNIDLLPTVLDVLGEQSPGLPGRSLVPERFIARPAAFATHFPPYAFFSDFEKFLGPDTGLYECNVQRRAMRDDRYKYVALSDGRRKLYDIRNDPTESQNLAKTQPQVAAQMDQKLTAWWDSQPAYVRHEGRSAAPPRDEKHQQQLRELGYVGD